MQFEQSNEINADLVALFAQTVLGTNGAKYKHLDVVQSVKQTDNPLSFSLRRNELLIANITFCKRPFGLYLRYFAFDKRFQSRGKARANQKSSIKQKIEGVFEQDITKWNCDPEDDCDPRHTQPFNVPDFLFAEIEQMVVNDLSVNMKTPVDPSDDKQNILR